MENIKNIQKKDTFEEIDKLSPEIERYWQVDLMKVFAMILVIMDHSIPHADLHALGSPFWQRIAIPLFLVILGFNWSKSLEKHKIKPLRVLYSWDTYFKHKLLRFFVPFGILYGLSLIFFFISLIIPDYYRMDISYYADPMLKIILSLPMWGPGDWFIPLLFLTVLIFPIIYKFFTKQPYLALVTCFLLEFIWYVLIFNVRVFWANRSYVPIGVWNYYNTITILRCTPFRSLSAIGLGVWLADDHCWNSSRNIIIWILGILSGIYLFYYTFRDFRINLFLGDYHMFHFPWSALLIMIALNVFPKEPYGKNSRFITLLSKSTYHILMVQIFYFSIIYNYLLPMFGDYPIWSSLGTQYYWLNYVWYYPLNLVLTFSLGSLWYQLENKFIWEQNKNLEKRRYNLLKMKGWIK